MHPAVKAGMAERKSVRGWNCKCDKCKHTWWTPRTEPPKNCAGCRKKHWWANRPVGRPRIWKPKECVA